MLLPIQGAKNAGALQKGKHCSAPCFRACMGEDSKPQACAKICPGIIALQDRGRPTLQAWMLPNLPRALSAASL